MSEKDALSISWLDSAWIPILNQSNVLDYFSERSNPFYDRTCNNEIIKMQRLNPEQLNSMNGLEYILLHVQEPILYVIRKQNRHSAQQATPITDYYIIAGTVYQAPDLCSVINCRLLNTIHNLQSAFEESLSYARYHPSKGYWWEFKDQKEQEKKESKDVKKEEPSSMFQRQRVDMLLMELSKKYPPKIPPPPQPENKEETAPKRDIKTEVKTEKPEEKQQQTAAASAIAKPPPEKKPRLIR